MMEPLKLASRKAFTLLEMTVALLLISIIIAIPVSNFSRFNDDLNNSMFIKSFKSDWNYALINSKINHSTILVHLNKNTQDIEFKGEKFKKNEVLPKNLFLESNGIKKIGNDGTVQPFTITIRDLRNNKLKKLKIQMNWGEIVEE